MRISVDHTTHYAYERPVRYSTQYLRLVPRSSRRQQVLEWRLETPAPALELSDGYGNVLHVLTIDRPVPEIVIRAGGVVQTASSIDEKDDDEARLSPLLFLRSTALTRADEALIDFAELFRRRAGTSAGLRDLSAAILEHLPFLPGVTAVHSTAGDAFAAGNGVCQDHAHVFIACCRHLGVPARYVSGYIYSEGHAQSAVASHAWGEAWVVDRWRSFDVTNSRPAGPHHIKVAIGADYLEASPVRGVRAGGGVEHLSAHAVVAPQ